MSDQPKPTASGEWTAEWLRDQIPPHYSNDATALQICQMHNAALAAERAKLEKVIDEEIANNNTLREQLAAEREKVQPLVEALREVNALARGNMTGCGTCNHVIDATIKVL